MDNGKLLIQAVKQGNDALVVKLLNAGIPPYICDQVDKYLFCFKSLRNDFSRQVAFMF